MFMFMQMSLWPNRLRVKLLESTMFLITRDYSNLGDDGRKRAETAVVASPNEIEYQARARTQLEVGSGEETS